MRLPLDVNQALIDRLYNGDADAFYKSVRNANKECLDWKDIEKDARELPEYETHALFAIELYLGYLPPKYIIIKSEPYIRQLVKLYHHQEMDYDDFSNKCLNEVARMRNKDIVEHACTQYGDIYHQLNQTFFREFSAQARQRIKLLLGYEPTLEASLGAELLMRQYLASDIHYVPEDALCIFDVRCYTIIKYREVLLQAGKAEADRSESVGHYLVTRFKAGKIF